MEPDLREVRAELHRLIDENDNVYQLNGIRRVLRTDADRINRNNRFSQATSAQFVLDKLMPQKLHIVASSGKVIDLRVPPKEPQVVSIINFRRELRAIILTQALSPSLAEEAGARVANFLVTRFDVPRADIQCLELCYDDTGQLGSKWIHPHLPTRSKMDETPLKPVDLDSIIKLDFFEADHVKFLSLDSVFSLPE
jgi:hypothetical protein